MQSIFTDKAKIPIIDDLKKPLGKSFNFWEIICDFTLVMYPAAKSSWNFSGEKYGWNYRISDKKRVLVYLLPRAGFFKVAFVFGKKATDAIMQSNVSENIKTELSNAKVYAEGRGIRIDVTKKETLNDIRQLIKIKIAN